jgi:hypothetical protein
MRTLLLVLFSVAWAAVAFAVIRAIVIAFGFHRRLATATAVAVAGAYLLGAASPFSLAQRGASEPPAAPAVAAKAPAPIGCPANAKLVAAPGQGHIDTLSTAGTQANPDAVVQVSRDATLRLTGWVVSTGGPATSLCVVLDGRPVAFEGDYGFDRPDVAAAVGKPEDRSSGFDVRLRVPPGNHALTVGAVQPDGSLTPLAQVVKLRVR